MSEPGVQPRILLVTPEVTFIPDNTKHTCPDMIAHGVRSAVDLVCLIFDLYDFGVDVHVAQPDYRHIFKTFSPENRHKKARKFPAERVHLTEDRAFFYSRYLDSNYKWENIKISLAFQREVINQIIPRVQPDVIHCHDWMTGLLPSMAKKMDIPCLFTVHNSHSAKSCLSYIEDVGIDAAAFWQNLFYDSFPSNYEQTRDANPVDFLLSGVLAASFVNTTIPAFLPDVVEGRSVPIEASLRQLLAQKRKAGHAFAVHHQVPVKHYVDAYEKMLRRPIIRINTKKRQSRLTDARKAA